ncbi:hypothetical protein SH2C18_21600 [Clostridium sediminicola]|uniref:hypothetical protein n=1 Tax=Clostridium sediminicola TaxID=3114879 RepID=UPI0031F1D5FC
MLTGVLWGISKNTAVGALLFLCILTMFVVITVENYSKEGNEMKGDEILECKNSNITQKGAC